MHWREAKKARSSYKYRMFRKRMRNQEPLCRICKTKGIIKAGKELDHIVPLSKGGALMSENNVQHLCKECHDEKSDAENRRNVRVDIDGNVTFARKRTL